MVRYRKPLPLNGFGDTYVSRHRFANVVSLNPGVGGVATYTFRANGIFDPEVSALTGTQPRGTDQMAVLFSHCYVLGSKITIKPAGPLASTNNTDPTAIYGCSLQNAPVFVGTDWSDIATQRNGGYGASVSKHIMDSRSITRKFSAKRFFKTKEIVGNPDHKGGPGSAGSDPTEGAYFHLWLTSPNALADYPDTLFTVTIEYIVMYTERKPLPES